MISPREKTRSGSPASSVSSFSSNAVSGICSPSSRAWCLARSSSSPPTRSFAIAWRVSSSRRRSNARTRATSSGTENGFVT